MPPKAKNRRRTKTTKKRPARKRTTTTTKRRRKTFARQTIDKQTKQIKATYRKAFQIIRQSDASPQVKKARMAATKKDMANAIKYYQSKITRIQASGAGLIKGMRAVRGMDPAIKKAQIKELQENIKYHIARSVELFGPDYD